MGRTCCPQYTIRLHAAEFKPSRHQRSAVNRWNRFLSTGLKPGEQGDDEMAGKQPGEAKKGKGKGKAKPFDLVAELRAHQVGYGYDSATAKHRFEVSLLPVSELELTCPARIHTRNSHSGDICAVQAVPDVCSQGPGAQGEHVGVYALSV